MAEYYQVVNQTDKTTELTQFYPTTPIEDNPTIQYVVSPSEQTQFPSQQVVVSERLMVVDGKPQQVVLDQYQAPSYIIQDSVDFPENRQVYYMASNSQTPVVVDQPSTQPVVLNHQFNPLEKLSNLQGQVEQNTEGQDRTFQQIRKNLAEKMAQVNDIKGEVETTDYVTLGDGTMVTLPIYRKIMAQQQKTLQGRLETGLVGGMQQPAQKSKKSRNPRPRVQKLKQQNPGGGGGRERLLMRSQEPVEEHFSEQVPAPSAQPETFQQQLNRNQIQSPYIIQPPSRHLNKPQIQKPLSQFLHSHQIRNIIDSIPLNKEFSDSIRMLVLLDNGEQRLITFTLPKEACTIHEILEQVNVPFTSETRIQVIEANTSGINYIVTVGDVSEFLIDDRQSEEAVNATATVTSEQSYQLSIIEQPVELKETPPKPPTPEPPKLIPGKLALCLHCGYLSEHFNRCTRCKTKLPDNVKAISSNSTIFTTTTNGKKSDQRSLTAAQINSLTSTVDRKLPLLKSGLNIPKLNLLQKKRNVNSVVKSKLNEFETVVVSSDEEDDKKSPVKNVNEQLMEKLGSAVTISPISKEPSVIDIQKNCLQMKQEKIVNEQLIFTLIICRTIRIGSYRFMPPEAVRLDSSGIHLKVPLPKQENTLKLLKINNSDIVKVLICFQKALPVIFYYLTPSVGVLIRKELDMAQGSDYYFDPLSEMEESHRRLTLLPEQFTDENKCNLQKMYRNILDELTYKEANDILIKTCPKELTRAVFTSGGLTDVKQLLMYPPEGRGRISINTEDYLCLGHEQFLNDVIIDFYLTYLFNNLSNEQQKRVHLFSTFFYKRLTTKPVKASRKSQPTELDPHLTPAEKRHARVKTWTKNVNIFDKDFIIIPINESCHWFLAIICFPWMNGTETMEGETIKIEPIQKNKKKTVNTIGNVTITTTLKTAPEPQSILCEDNEGGSDKDEAEGDDSELESDDSDEQTAPVVNINEKHQRPPIKQPCILIFDSLAGASRCRVVATLRDYLTCEYKAKLGEEKIFTKDVIKGACPKVPQQTNFTDCGLYLLQYVEEFFKNPIKDYYIPINHLKTWFEESIVAKKREDISLLIKSLMQQYGQDLSLIPQDVTFPPIDEGENKFADDEEEEEDMEEEEEDDEEDDDDEDFVPRKSSSSTTSIQSNLTVSDIKPSSDSIGNDFTVVDANVIKPDMSELPTTKTTNKDTLSYLKAKRIVRHKNHNSNSNSDAPESKKIKANE